MYYIQFVFKRHCSNVCTPTEKLLCRSDFVAYCFLNFQSTLISIEIALIHRIIHYMELFYTSKKHLEKGYYFREYFLYYFIIFN